MDDQGLFEAMAAWNFWDRSPPAGHPREITGALLRLSNTPDIVTIHGVRRAGKSTVMFQVMNGLRERGLPAAMILYLDLEEPAFGIHADIGILDRLLSLYRDRLNPEGLVHVFLDEAQRIPGWERWVRARSEQGEIKAWVTGSSSALLSAEFGTLLTGRHLSFRVHPVSFSEFLSFRGDGAPTSAAGWARSKPRLRRLLREYFRYGGFPEVVLRDEPEMKDRLLKQYFEDILYRDVLARFKIRDFVTLRAVALVHMNSMAALTSYNRIKGVLGAPLEVVRQYSGYLEEACLIHEVKRHSFKVSEQLRNPRKTYAEDAGLRNAVAYRFSEDLGRIAENVVYLRLLSAGAEVWYHSGHGEVDFLLREGTRCSGLVQVCMADSGEAFDREVSSLEEAMQSTGLREGLLIGEGRDETLRTGAGSIRIVPLVKWLLGPA